MEALQGDVLDLLLPGAAQTNENHARRVVTFLRLLRDDARGQGAETVGIDLPRARQELARGDRKRRFNALADLLRYYLHAALPRDSFVHFGRPGSAFQRAWGLLDGLGIPRPREGELQVAKRILDWAQADGASRRWLSVWRTRYIHVRLGYVGAKPAWNSLWKRARKTDDRALGSAVLLGQIQGSLDRGDLKGAHRFLGLGLDFVPSNRHLARCQLWVALLEGDPKAARELGASSYVAEWDERDHPLPLPLSELKRQLPAWGSLLPGRARNGGQSPQASFQQGRRCFGASALAVLRLDPTRGMIEPLRWDLEPGWSSPRDDFLRRRRGAWTRTGEAEYQVLVLGRTVVKHVVCGSPTPWAIGEGCKSLALVPALDPSGVPRGWIQLEFKHHLIPSLDRLDALAGSWASHWPHGNVHHGEQGVKSSCAVRRPGDAEWEGELARHASALLERLPLGLGARGSVFFDCPRGVMPRPLATRGALAKDAQPVVGIAVQRVVASGAPLGFTRSPELGALSAARSGILAPLVLNARVAAVVALESKRAGHFDNADLVRLTNFAKDEAAAWDAVKFSLWHSGCFGERVADPSGCSWWREKGWGGLLVALQPLSIYGETAAGKMVFARWIHHASRGPERPFVSLDCSTSGPSTTRLAQAWQRALGGTLCLRHPGQLARKQQAALLGWIGERLQQGEPECVRVMALFSPSEGNSRGLQGIEPRLECLLKTLELNLPPLRDRRDWIPDLVRCILHSVVVGEASAPPQLEDAAMGFLWRQTWSGNLGELRAFLTRLAIMHAGQVVGLSELHRLAFHFQSPIAKRLCSRRPRRLDIEAALAQTSWANGRANKTRAALYLGWDPDTLVARMEEHGLHQPGA